MPRFSVIVPAYKVQAYPPACPDSVLSRSCPDLDRVRVHHRQRRRGSVPGVPVPPGVRLRHALLRLGPRRTWEALRLASALLRRTRKRLAKARGTVRTAALRLHYAVQRRLPVRADRALFATEGGRGYGGDPGTLEEAFRTLAPHVRTAWAAAPAHHHTVPPGTRRLTPGTAAYWTALARSRYLVHASGLDAGLVERRGQVVVRTQPGTPLRYAGLDLQERPAAARGAGAARLLTTVDTARAFAPGPVAYDEDELIGLFTGGQWRGPRSTLLRAAFRERFRPHDDGRAAERVVRRVVLAETDLPPVVPLDARRPAPPSPALSPGPAGAEGRPSPAVARAPLAAVPRPTGPRTVTESL
ncbi:CDP-glycerol glycerophosphotransferase family protein [Streptomyces sp. NPDC018947]|uniref:CDP-glycerol glycerophosphotransferase family protein n=1 Tax=Streptomyces sp. NPDC018947 TaxID=3365054 RepID=UPI0037A892E1